MGQYSKAIITAAGQSLIARAFAGEAQLNITKAKTSDYKYPDGTDYKVLTDMEGIKQVLDSPETKVLSNDLIQIRVLFSNEEIKATYYIQNIGLYAMDGTKEVLFCIVTAAIPDEMPQYNGVAATSYIYNIQSVVHDAETIHITVSPAGNATIQDVMERVDATGGDISETVIETLEPIDTKYPVPSAGESTKIFMGKIKKYIEDTKPVDADMFVYVATTGSDTTGDGTVAKPFKTIQYAINSLPKDLGSFGVTIDIADGTYNERVVVRGFYNGFFRLTSSKPEEISSVCNLLDVTVYNNSTTVDIRGINFTTTTSNAVYTVTSGLVLLYHCRCTTTSTWSGFSFDQTRFETYACLVANRGIALMAHGSDGNSQDWYTSSNNNTVGIHAEYGSIVKKRGGQPAGTAINERKWSGGMIINENGTQISDLISAGLSCTWGTLQGGYVRHGNLDGRAMITIQLRVQLTTTLSAGIDYLIYGFPTTFVDTPISCNIPSNIVNGYINTAGIMVLRLINPFNSGSIFVFNCTYRTTV